MLENKSSDYKTLVLLRVIKKLIENSKEYGMYKLERIVFGDKPKIEVEPEKTFEEIEEERKEQIKKEVKEKIEKKIELVPPKEIQEKIIVSKPEKKQNIQLPLPPKPKQIPLKGMVSPPPRMNLNKGFPPRQRPVQESPDYILPEHLRYLQPTKTENAKQIDLKKLNPLIGDNNVRVIECSGENENVIVIGNMGKRPTGIKLSKQEIDEIIEIFSKESKIPTKEGLFKVTVDNLIFAAMISEKISSRFVIRKI
jgi:hypothetical protein